MCVAAQGQDKQQRHTCSPFDFSMVREQALAAEQLALRVKTAKQLALHVGVAPMQAAQRAAVSAFVGARAGSAPTSGADERLADVRAAAERLAAAEAAMHYPNTDLKIRSYRSKFRDAAAQATRAATAAAEADDGGADAFPFWLVGLDAALGSLSEAEANLRSGGASAATLHPLGTAGVLRDFVVRTAAHAAELGHPIADAQVREVVEGAGRTTGQPL